MATAPDVKVGFGEALGTLVRLYEPRGDGAQAVLDEMIVEMIHCTRRLAEWRLAQIRARRFVGGSVDPSGKNGAERRR